MAILTLLAAYRNNSVDVRQNRCVDSLVMSDVFSLGYVFIQVFPAGSVQEIVLRVSQYVSISV